ncbi:hypothetical protein VIGAN_08278500 [Vigna angularis var. angularis]|uniref:Uncharacterized protein n=1 Tax=Vigna angularis var. angularis TaxID=157739 RepID=A0A0S3SSY8_PHAAN|nr:hypothetical protein VIGAN_08278500 [Vigna angularis var. angularis]
MPHAAGDVPRSSEAAIGIASPLRGIGSSHFGTVVPSKKRSGGGSITFPGMTTARICVCLLDAFQMHKFSDSEFSCV